MPWSAEDMKSTQIASLQTKVVPLAFLAASALPNVGCADDRGIANDSHSIVLRVAREKRESKCSAKNAWMRAR